MKFATASSIALLSTLASAAINSVNIYVESSVSDINGNELSPQHEGAGINYLFLSSSGTNFAYDDSSHSLEYADGNGPNFFDVKNGVAQVNLGGSSTDVTFQNGYLAVNGSTDGFYAQKNIDDPYQISKSSYVLAYYKGGAAPRDAIPLKLTTKKGAAPSASSSSSGYFNATVTTDEVETVFTTYCPEATTLVVVTCTETKCQPKSVTVTAPGSVTITGYPTTPASLAPATTAAPKSAAPKSAAPKSTTPKSAAPAVTTATGGANANAVGGLIFAAGIAGLLI